MKKFLAIIVLSTAGLVFAEHSIDHKSLAAFFDAEYDNDKKSSDVGRKMVIAREPKVAVSDPRVKVKKPRVHLEGPTITLEQPTIILKNPKLMLQRD